MQRLAISLTLAALGCNPPPPTGTPASMPAPPATAPVESPLAPGAGQWSRDEAAQRLPDDRLGISAAFRLTQLAGLTPDWAPVPLTPEAFEGARLRRLDDMRWIIGQEARGALRAPLLLLADGSVLPLVQGPEASLADFAPSEHPDSMPHVIVTPTRVLTLSANAPQPALSLRTPSPALFRVQMQDGYARVALHDGDGVELVTYRWDALEGVFMGPAAEALPDPPGGRFELDLSASPLLMPVGGDIADAPPEPEIPATQPPAEPPPMPW